jgi:hypothetical protein
MVSLLGEVPSILLYDAIYTGKYFSEAYSCSQAFFFKMQFIPSEQI